jgi:hypothetical protein
MIIDKSDKSIVSTGIQSEAFFTVKQENLSHLLGILRNQLYSDKILAVIREYSTNAMDANIDAGVADCPIQVSLPNSFSPIFKVRDFGKGLSEEQIYNIYISFGDSSKRNTNDQTGCLGLGSKSAFSYVDNFTLTSYHGGLKSVYSAFIDESEIGKITRLTCEPSDEPTGIEVSIAVKAGDYSQFFDKCFDVLKYFNPKPIIHNDNRLQDLIDSSDKNPILSVDNWTITRQINHSRSHVSLKVVMGNVAYPINLDALGIGYKYKEYIHSFYNMEIAFKAPIGAVKNSASREALDYSPKTKTWLFDTLANFKEQVGAELSKQMESAKTMWEALLMYNELKNKIGSNNDFTFRGKKITNQYIKLPQTNNKFRKVKKNRNCNLAWDTTEVITPHTEARIFIDKGNIKRSELFGRVESYGDITEQTYLLQFDNVAQADEFLASDSMEGCPCVDLTDAPFVKKARQPRGVKSVFSEAYQFKQTWITSKSDNWEPCQIDVSNGEGVYVVISHFSPVNKLVNANAIERFQISLKGIGIDLPIYGVRGKTASTLGAGWKSYEQYRKELFDSLTVKHGLYYQWDYETTYIEPVLKHFASFQFDDFEFPQVIQDVLDVIKYVKNIGWNRESDLARAMFEDYRNSHTSNLKSKRDLIYEKYPMLKFVDEATKPKDIRAVKDYINLVG